MSFLRKSHTQLSLILIQNDSQKTSFHTKTVSFVNYKYSGINIFLTLLSRI